MSGEIHVGRKLFDETDRPMTSKIIFENKEEGIVERESTSTGEIKGYDPFPSGRATGSGRSYIHNNGITISHWQGELTTEDQEEQKLTFKGRDVNKNGKFVVLRSYFTESEILGWINGLVCILSGEFEPSAGLFKSTGYELIL
jgi:hypothetical protein